MTETLLQIPAEIVKVESRKNRSVRLVVDSQEELHPEVRSKLMAMVESFGWFCFLVGEKQIDAMDIAGIPEIPKREEDNGRSPSVRQRGILYRIWEQKGKNGPFETYYLARMEAIAEKLKEELT